MTKNSIVDEKAIKTAVRIRRALELISPNIDYIIKPIESSYSFFGPKFCIDGVEHDIDSLLEEQFGLFARKFLNYRHINFHDVRVTWCTGKFNVYHSTPEFNCGYFRVDYIASEEIPTSGYRPEGHYYLLNRGDQSCLIRISDFAGVSRNSTADVLEVNPLTDITDGRSHFITKLFATSDELIDLSGHYFIKEAIIMLIKCDKASAARNVYRDAIQKGIYLPPFLVTDKEEEFQKAVKFINTKYPEDPYAKVKGCAKVYPIFLKERTETLEKSCDDKCCDKECSSGVDINVFDDGAHDTFDWEAAIQTTGEAQDSIITKGQIKALSKMKDGSSSH